MVEIKVDRTVVRGITMTTVVVARTVELIIVIEVIVKAVVWVGLFPK